MSAPLIGGRQSVSAASVATVAESRQELKATPKLKERPGDERTLRVERTRARTATSSLSSRPRPTSSLDDHRTEHPNALHRPLTRNRPARHHLLATPKQKLRMDPLIDNAFPERPTSTNPPAIGKELASYTPCTATQTPSVATHSTPPTTATAAPTASPPLPTTSPPSQGSQPKGSSRNPRGAPNAAPKSPSHPQFLISLRLLWEKTGVC
jgi:hypothetical protein